MKRRSPFNFEEDLQNLQAHINLPQEDYEQHPFKESVVAPDMPHSKQMRDIAKEEQTKVSKSYKFATQVETVECMLYAFCHNEKGESTLSILVLQKRTGKRLQMPLKKLQFDVSYIKFVYSSSEEIHLLVGTKCGKILIYRNLQQTNLTVNIVHISANQITFILVPSFPNYVFVLSKIGTIYLFNFEQGRVHYEFRCSLPLLEDPSPRLILDLSETLLGHVFSYGRVILWQITDEIKKSLHPSNQEAPKKYKDGFKIVIRYKMSMANCFVKGVIWIDFMGIFLAFISLEGEFKLLGINVNQFYQHHQFFTVITHFAICNSQKTQGKHYEKQTITEALRLQDNSGIIVAKNIQTYSNNDKLLKSCSVIEKYTFDHGFKLNKVTVVSLPKISLIKQLLLSSQGDFILIRGDKQYSIVIDKGGKIIE